MATLSELTIQVNTLTTLVNGIINNSKQISDLDLQDVLDISSQIAVNGNEKITVQQILDELSGTTIVTKSIDYTANIDEVVLADPASSEITITLPTAVGNNGRKVSVKKIDGLGYSVIIDGNSTETIDGNETIILTTQFDSITLISDGSDWHIL